jgi:hypothetical protein
MARVTAVGSPRAQLPLVKSPAQLELALGQARHDLREVTEASVSFQ